MYRRIIWNNKQNTSHIQRNSLSFHLSFLMFSLSSHVPLTPSVSFSSFCLTPSLCVLFPRFCLSLSPFTLALFFSPTLTVSLPSFSLFLGFSLSWSHSLLLLFYLSVPSFILSLSLSSPFLSLSLFLSFIHSLSPLLYLFLAHSTLSFSLSLGFSLFLCLCLGLSPFFFHSVSFSLSFCPFSNTLSLFSVSLSQTNTCVSPSSQTQTGPRRDLDKDQSHASVTFTLR